MTTMWVDAPRAASGGGPGAGRPGRARRAWRACQVAGAGLATCLLTGCFIIKLTILGAVAVVGLTGYVVYQAGDAAVTGVGNAARATGSAVSSGTRSAVKVVYSNGELRADTPGDVATVWQASQVALQRGGFRAPTGSHDALSGTLTAQTHDGSEIAIRLRTAGPGLTEMRIRVGVRGNRQMSQTIHGLVLAELDATPGPLAASQAEATP